jgi:hypothetical protein
LNDHELGFLQFLGEPGRRRMQTLLELGPKRRPDVRASLDHAIVLDERHVTRMVGEAGSTANLEALLRRHGAPQTCFVISSDKRMDGLEMPLSDALSAVVGSGFGTYLSCVAGKLGYFEYEDLKSAWLLRR